MAQETTRRPDLTQVRRNANSMQARLTDPQNDPLAFALAMDAHDLATEVERLRAGKES